MYNVLLKTLLYYLNATRKNQHIKIYCMYIVYNDGCFATEGIVFGIIFLLFVEIKC